MLIGFMFTTTIFLALIWGMLGNIFDELKEISKKLSQTKGVEE
jgi:hypothetical protein